MKTVGPNPQFLQRQDVGEGHLIFSPITGEYVFAVSKLNSAVISHGLIVMPTSKSVKILDRSIPDHLVSLGSDWVIEPDFGTVTSVSNADRNDPKAGTLAIDNGRIWMLTLEIEYKNPKWIEISTPSEFDNPPSNAAACYGWCVWSSEAERNCPNGAPLFSFVAT